nr:unnamed protein product [Spirometra erinaceieuropaei]
MSSKQLTPAQMKVLSHEACFNTADADPVSLVATVESILKQTGQLDETTHLIRQQVTSLVMAHKPRTVITRAGQRALKALRTDTSLVTPPADKERSTVVLCKAESIQKVKDLLEDPQDLAIEMVSELLGKQYDETDESVKRRHLVELLKFCLKTYFAFEETTYEQIRGTPMRSPLSGFKVEAVL